MKFICLLSLFFSIVNLCSLKAQSIQGKVTSKSGLSLPYANISVLNSSMGTTTNESGNYILKLLQGEYKIVFSYLGYKSDTLKVDININQILIKDIALESSPIKMSPVYVSADNINLGAQIILKVIDNKQDYLSKIKNYTYDAYTKTVIKVSKKDSIITAGILQNLSKGYFSYPDNFQEVVIAKKQTKNFSEENNIFNTGRIPSLLDDKIQIDELSIYSPISKDGMKYYNYEIKDTTYYKGYKIFSIEFKPKDQNVPLFSGKVKIIDKIYTVVFFDLNGESSVVPSGIRNVSMRCEFSEYQNYFWLPKIFTENYQMNFNIPGLPPIYVEQTSLLSDYILNSQEFDHKFNNKVFLTELSDKEKEASLWQSQQIIPLTIGEKNDMCRIDSLVEHASFVKKTILKAVLLVTNYNSAISDLPISDFNNFYHYNRVEGSYIGLGLDSKNIFQPFRITAKYGYGISDKKNKFKVNLGYKLSNNVNINFIRSNDLSYFNRYYDYSQFDITYSSLFEKNDYADYYYANKYYAFINFNFSNIWKFNLGFDSENQTNVLLNANWSLFNKAGSFRQIIPIAEGKINSLLFDFNYDTRKYVDLGWCEVPDFSSNYFDFYLRIIYSSKKYLESNYNFQSFFLHVNSYNQFSYIFNTYLTFEMGNLSGDKMPQYLFHFPGNFSTFSGENIFRTILNDNYFGKRYIGLFVENNFKNYLFNISGIPFLKNVPYNLLLFSNIGLISGSPNNDLRSQSKIWEVGFGVGNILSFFRIDFSWELFTEMQNHFNISLGTSIIM
ncbi:MAG: DUF5686 and carboxypeptidase-like regulatory domain-containing protein [Ignavibacteriaceae bacterium]